MTTADVVLSVKGTRRQRGSEPDGFRLEVPRLAVQRGECVAITGPSGSGKSTLLDLLGLVLAPDRSEGFALKPAAGPAIDVARLWQDARPRRAGPHPRPPYRLRAADRRPAAVPSGDRQHPAVAGASSASTTATGWSTGSIDALGIRPLLAKKPQALSIGERQRVAIARALAHRPALLLADEPTAALDPGQAVGVMKLLLALVREFRITAVIVSHDWDLVVGARSAPGAGGAGRRRSRSPSPGWPDERRWPTWRRRGRQWWQTCVLAWQDFAYEWRVSICLVFALAAVLAPLLVLFGLKSGIITTMTERLRADPRNLEIILRGHQRLDAAWFAAVRARPDVGFVLPRTRLLAATVSLESAGGATLADIDMLPTAAGDPLLPAGTAPAEGLAPDPADRDGG